MPHTHEAVCGRVGRAHAEQQTREPPCPRQGGKASTECSEQDHGDPLPQYELHHILRSGAQSHANTELPRPLRDRVSDDAIESNGGEQQSRHTGDAGQHRSEPLREKGDRNPVGEDGRIHQRRVRIQRSCGCPHPRRELRHAPGPRLGLGRL